MDEKKYDLIVIGSGPAGEKGAAQAAYFGKKVAMVEKDSVLGGVAYNTALPAQTLREVALYLACFRQRNLYGVNVSLKEKITARDFLFRERLVKQSERVRIIDNLKRHNVDLCRGAASFADPHTVAVKPRNSPETFLKGDIILIATGSTPHHPAVFPFHDMRVYDSDSILNLHEMPPTILIVGGGVVGCEYACAFAALGIRVTLVESRERLLAFLDQEVALALSTQMRAMGIDILLQESVASVLAGDVLQARLRSDNILNTHAILVAVGRDGNTAGLGLEKIDLIPTAHGHLQVNSHYQTAVPHIYAAGDVIGFPAMASTSMEQARVAMVHAFDLKYKTQLAHILPYGLYTIPECSMAGETEESLTEKQIPYVVGRARYDQNARGQIIGDKQGFLKLLFREKDMKLLGVHVLGEHASELVHVGLLGLLMGGNSDMFIQTCFNYPTLSELYKYATYDAMGRRQKPSAGA